MLDKRYPDTKEKENPYTREWLKEQVDKYLEEGGEIKTIPEGESAEKKNG